MKTGGMLIVTIGESRFEVVKMRSTEVLTCHESVPRGEMVFVFAPQSPMNRWAVVPDMFRFGTIHQNHHQNDSVNELIHQNDSAQTIVQ